MAARQLLALSGLMEGERSLSLRTVTKHPHQEEALAALRDLGKAFRERRDPWSILLQSDGYGTGKSYLTWALVADLCRLGVPAFVLPETRMFALLRAAERGDAEFGSENLRHEWARHALLVLDDVGTGTPTPFACTELYSLVEWRRRNRRPVIVTTNLDGDALAAWYGVHGGRIVSRLVEMCRGGQTWITVEGPDLRLPTSSGAQ